MLVTWSLPVQNKLLEYLTSCHNSTIWLHVIKAFLITSVSHVYTDGWNSDTSPQINSLTLKFCSHRQKKFAKSLNKKENRKIMPFSTEMSHSNLREFSL